MPKEISSQELINANDLLREILKSKNNVISTQQECIKEAKKLNESYKDVLIQIIKESGTQKLNQDIVTRNGEGP